MRFVTVGPQRCPWDPGTLNGDGMSIHEGLLGSGRRYQRKAGGALFELGAVQGWLV
jgi:hypothetical protein